mgnify:CR=1 FL=1
MPSSLILAIQQANSIHPEWFPFEQIKQHSVWINAQQIFQSSSFFSFILGRFGTLLTSASLSLDTNIWIFWEIFTKFDGFHKYLGFFFLKFYNAIVFRGFQSLFCKNYLVHWFPLWIIYACSQQDRPNLSCFDDVAAQHLSFPAIKKA